MLQSLHIKNVALIDEAELIVGEGLNILSGETGAGKSMIIDSLGLILGGKAGKDVIRTGQDNASVTAVFSVDDGLKPVLSELGVDVAEDDALIITRQISSTGKGTCRINGVLATVAMLRQVGAVLVDIHGQHEHQSLLSQLRHISLLDKFADSAASSVKDKLADAIRKYRDVSRKIAAIGDGGSAKARLEMLLYQQAEIEEVNPQGGDDRRLEKLRDVLVNSVKIKELTGAALNLLYQDESGDTAFERMTKAAAQLHELAKLDGETAKFADAVDVMVTTLRETCRDIYAYSDNLADGGGDLPGTESESSKIDKIERKLEQLHMLKKKYGGSVGAVLQHLEHVKTEIEELRSSDERLEQLGQEKRALSREVSDLCAALSAIRKEYAATITAGVSAALADLGMPDAMFDVEITRSQAFGTNGFDRVEFMISANKGEPLKPLAKIASGGEMSRVMLALKSVLADTDEIETFIFDEIDAGISGRTAQMVAEKLSRLARGRQILCITHLPQIAALADAHFLIEKHSDSESTRTTVVPLDDEACVYELARLTGGAKITDATLTAAREMKRLAREVMQL
ncbi:MAG: DNA repair protein RecN [Defluviitaleaceae bacterium]|nr:DNA repair protein RecN [Defluviitaleaceae bacterium]